MDAKAQPKVMSWPGREHGRWNPYLSELVDAIEQHGVNITSFQPWMLLTGKVDVLHIHWPDAFVEAPHWGFRWLRVVVLWAVLRICSMRQIAVVWTVHNLASHAERASARRQRSVAQLMRRYVCLQIHLSEATQGEMLRLGHRAGGRPFVVVPHASYRIGSTPSNVDARHVLDLNPDGIVLGHIGTMTRYKGSVELAQTFTNTPCRDAVLLMAGLCDDPEMRTELSRLASADPRIRLKLGWLSEGQLVSVIAASDWILCPYTRVLNSGSVMRALSQWRGVLVPDTEAFRELAAEVGEAWVRRFEGRLTPKVIGSILESPIPTGRPRLDARTADAAARGTIDAYALAQQKISLTAEVT